MLVLLLRRQCLVLWMLTIEVYQQFFCTFCVVRGRVVLHPLLLVCSLLDRIVDVLVLKSKSAVVAEVLDVSSQELVWITRLKVATVFE